jgi:hypothetical protein
MGPLEEGQEEGQEEGADLLTAPTLLKQELLLTVKLRRPQ